MKFIVLQLMPLSKKNLAKLKSILNKENTIKYKISDKSSISDSKSLKNDHLIKVNDPNKIFYSIIDNSESLDETSNVNHSLRKSEIKQINTNSREANYCKKLSTEEELYDEFNYLLEE